jgi:hypothetical protein
MARCNITHSQIKDDVIRCVHYLRLMIGYFRPRHTPPPSLYQVPRLSMMWCQKKIAGGFSTAERKTRPFILRCEQPSSSPQKKNTDLIIPVHLCTCVICNNLNVVQGLEIEQTRGRYEQDYSALTFYSFYLFGLLSKDIRRCIRPTTIMTSTRAHTHTSSSDLIIKK